MSGLSQRLAVVVLTHNRAAELRRTLEKLCGLPEQPRIIVVDNGSSDGTAAMVTRHVPDAELVAIPFNIGAAARNAGALKAGTPYVAFSDDDTWWEPGALAKAANLLDRYPQVAVLSARVLVAEEGRVDPTCALMAESPLPSDELPGPALLGFLAGACVMRRQPFLDAGGYEPNFFIGGEEALLTLDLVAAGWCVVYAPQLTVYHHPSQARDSRGRERLLIRNAFWVAWMRLPLAHAGRDTLRICRGSRPWVLGAALLAALRGLPWVVQRRRVLPENVLLLYRMLRG
jgi:GT2 family glycosyltransferase